MVYGMEVKWFGNSGSSVRDGLPSILVFEEQPRTFQSFTWMREQDRGNGKHGWIQTAIFIGTVYMIIGGDHGKGFGCC